jgi:hypothetical protein
LTAAQRARRAGPLADWVLKGWVLGKGGAGMTATRAGVTVTAKCWRSLLNRIMAAEYRMGK